MSAASKVERSPLLHRRIGLALERRTGTALAELAHHFVESAPLGEAQRAVEYARQAGDRARAGLAFEEAAVHYQRALSALDLAGDGDHAVRCDLHMALGNVLHHARDRRYRQALAAADEARRLGDARRLAQDSPATCASSSGSRDWERPAGWRPPWASVTGPPRSTTCWRRMRVARVVRARRLRSGGFRTRLLAATLGRLDEAESHFATSVAFCQRMDAPTWLARTRHEWARMLLTRAAPGDTERARQLAAESLAAAERLGMAGVAAQARALLEHPKPEEGLAP